VPSVAAQAGPARGAPGQASGARLEPLRPRAVADGAGADALPRSGARASVGLGLEPRGLAKAVAVQRPLLRRSGRARWRGSSRLACGLAPALDRREPAGRGQRLGAVPDLAPDRELGEVVAQRPPAAIRCGPQPRGAGPLRAAPVG